MSWLWETVFGTSEEKRPVKPQIPPLLKTPWRKIEWSANERVLQFVRNYQPRTEGQQLRILLHGPIGAGKSSFINSVQSTLHGRMYVHALADNIFHGSFTKTYKTYKIQKGSQDSFYPFVFNDVMGLDPDGPCDLVDDIKLALKGHVKDGYKFNPLSKLAEDDHFYNRNPTSNDKVHVLVCIFPADSVSRYLNDHLIWKKIRDIRMEASKLGIPQVAILTQIDKFSPEMGQNLHHVYRDQHLKNVIEQFSANVGIPMNCIFPVKNYSSEININSDVEALILSTLSNLINFGDDFINF